jgi:hypothetical protein
MGTMHAADFIQKKKKVYKVRFLFFFSKSFPFDFAKGREKKKIKLDGNKTRKKRNCYYKRRKKLDFHNE